MTSLGTPLAVAQVSAAWFRGFHLQPLGMCICQLMRGVVTSVAHLPAGRTVPQCALCSVLIGRTMGVGPGDWVKQIQFSSIADSNLKLSNGEPNL